MEGKDNSCIYSDIYLTKSRELWGEVQAKTFKEKKKQQNKRNDQCLFDILVCYQAK